MSRNPTMPEIRAAMDQARNLAGREDTETFSLEAPALLARLVQYLDLCVGHEPTLTEEADYVRREHRTETLTEVLAAIEDPTRREGLGWESARDTVRGMLCGWNPTQATTDCDWDRNCPVHGDTSSATYTSTRGEPGDGA